MDSHHYVPPSAQVHWSPPLPSSTLSPPLHPHPPNRSYCQLALLQQCPSILTMLQQPQPGWSLHSGCYKYALWHVYNIQSLIWALGSDTKLDSAHTQVIGQPVPNMLQNGYWSPLVWFRMRTMFPSFPLQSVIVQKTGYAMKGCTEMASASALQDGQESTVKFR